MTPSPDTNQVTPSTNSTGAFSQLPPPNFGKAPNQTSQSSQPAQSGEQPSPLGEPKFGSQGLPGILRDVLGGVLGKHAQTELAQSAAEKSSKIQSLINTITDPRSTPEQIHQATEDLGKTVGTKKSKDVAGKLGTLLQGILGSRTAEGRANLQQQRMQQSAQQAQTANTQAQQEGATTRASIEAGARQDVAQTGATGRADVAKIQADARAEATKTAAQSRIDVQKLRNDMENAKQANAKLAPGRTYSGHISMTPEHARNLHDFQGEDFNGPNGQAIDLDKIPQGQVLGYFTNSAGGFWQPYDPTQHTVKVGNEEVVVTPYNQEAIAEGKEPPKSLGVANPGSNSVTTVTPTGTQRQTTVPTPGVQPSGQPVKPSTPANPTTKGASQILGSPKSQLGGGLPSANYSTQQKTTLPILQAGVQIAGDFDAPNQPSSEILAPLADNPQSRARLAQATTMVFNAMDQAKTSMGDGFGAYVRTSFGLPAEVARAQADMMAQVTKNLTPAERDGLTQIIADAGTIIGMRAATGANPSALSFKNLENELPVPGFIGVGSSRDVYKKLAKLTQETYDYIVKRPDTVVGGIDGGEAKGKAVKQFLKNKMEYFREKSLQSPTSNLPKPAKKGELADAAVFAAYAAANNKGNKKATAAATRKAILAAGYTIK